MTLNASQSWGFIYDAYQFKYSFYYRDSVTGGTCNFDPQTNLPDADCVFVANGDNSDIKSSYMAAPFLESVTDFCNNTEVDYHHDIYKPTKHNMMCDYTDVWTVIKNNADFENVAPRFPQIMITFLLLILLMILTDLSSINKIQFILKT